MTIYKTNIIDQVIAKVNVITTQRHIGQKNNFQCFIAIFCTAGALVLEAI